MDLSLLQPIAQGVQQSWIKVGNVLNYSDPIPFTTLSDPSVLQAVVGKTSAVHAFLTGAAAARRRTESR